MGRRGRSEEDDPDGEVEREYKQEGWKRGLGAGTQWIVREKQRMASEARSPCLYAILPSEVVRFLGRWFRARTSG
jgi:hypothetical protein